MGRRSLPGQLQPKVIVAFLLERGFVFDGSRGDHKLYRKPGSGHVSLPDKPMSTRRGSYVFQNFLVATSTTREEFAAWFKDRQAAQARKTRRSNGMASSRPHSIRPPRTREVKWAAWYLALAERGTGRFRLSTFLWAARPSSR
jgi:predicted RNA binding protein YcfA (HicA-like mRNA interferase family)